MRTIYLEELKKLELDILIYIDRICRENHLRYFLCGGTLLGAIRHRGFIPWDDDIDICMPRPDYNELIKILNRSNGRYKILSPEQKDYYYNFSKIVDCKTVLNEYNYQPIDNMGVYVDIFPLEGMPNDRNSREEHFKKLDNLRKRINSFSWLKPKLRKNMISYFKRLRLYNNNKKACLSQYQKEYEYLVKQYDYDKSEYVYATGGAYGKKDIFLKQIFINSIDVNFESFSFSAPQKYDEYLKCLYGNYMEFPPKEKQKRCHTFNAYYK